MLQNLIPFFKGIKNFGFITNLNKIKAYLSQDNKSKVLNIFRSVRKKSNVKKKKQLTAKFEAELLGSMCDLYCYHIFYIWIVYLDNLFDNAFCCKKMFQSLNLFDVLFDVHLKFANMKFYQI